MEQTAEHSKQAWEEATSEILAINACRMSSAKNADRPNMIECELKRRNLNLEQPLAEVTQMTRVQRIQIASGSRIEQSRMKIQRDDQSHGYKCHYCNLAPQEQGRGARKAVVHVSSMLHLKNPPNKEG
jgi:hypothetical protein